MALPEPDPATREPTAAVAVMKRSPQRRRNRACPGPDLQQAPGCVVAHHDPARVARQALRRSGRNAQRSEEHTSELQSQSNLVCRLLLEKKKTNQDIVH